MADVKDILNISSDKTPNRVEAIMGKKKTPTQKKRKKPGNNHHLHFYYEYILKIVFITYAKYAESCMY